MKEISVVSKDKVGLLADVSEILGQHGVNIESIAMESEHDTAVIHLKVSKESEAQKILAKAGFKVVESNHLLLRISNRPGELAKVSRLLANAGINITNVFVLDERNGKKIVAFNTSNNAKAKKLLKDYS